MARNEEKQLGQLNRLYLHRQEEERRKKCPPRPKLHTLRTAADVTKHLPSIIKDIDISIKQSQVTCYTSETSEGYLAAADGYRREYEAFVRKLKSLDPNTAAASTSAAIPWTDRPYDRKRVVDAAIQSGAAAERAAITEAGSSKRGRRIESPLLLEEEELRSRQQQLLPRAPEAAVETLPALQDAPLQFDVRPTALAAAAAAAAALNLSRSCLVVATRRLCDSGGSHLPSYAAETGPARCMPLVGGGAIEDCSARQSEQWQSSLVEDKLPRAFAEEGSGGCSSSRHCPASGLARLCQVYGESSSSSDEEDRQQQQQQQQS